ncbi:RIP homotypic interaction motif-containing protein [Pseudomonas marginalis]|jgi:hypothetical protein|uniref:RIP homotypic interaction motif-containing protein n=1 Tax=Pseudomonas marginalis TaxID=298 RepID=UPI0011B3747B|nr:RIP homotypic interaction motif-containing protein [Pseudomonas marginalis]KAA8554670.1 hypothetical protein FX984_01283 [Pseudomonas marginalis]TWR69621.1 hypothetical protein FIV40_17860 [Pseudomonas marginalis]
MNPFASMHTDRVWLIKTDGRRLGPYNTRIGPSASIFEPSLDVDVGDHLERTLPNGKIELHYITECNYSQGLVSIGPHWSLKLRKGPEKESPPSKHTTINISNSTGIQVGDHNTQHIQEGIADLLKKIEESGASSEEVEQAKGRIAQMLEHPLVSSIIGSGVGALIGLAGA